MRATILEAPHQPLKVVDLPVPEAAPEQVLLQVRACGICRTDLHIVDGELPEPKLPLIPGHQIVGTVVGVGDKVERFKKGDRVGVPWLGHTCHHCRYCRRDRENLCNNAKFTGYQLDGGYAEYAVADEQFCFPIPEDYPDLQAAPLLCAGIHMSEIPSFPYDILWGERVLRSVANLTRQDGEEFLQLAPQVPIRTQVTAFLLTEANEALDALRAGKLDGAAVLIMD